MFSYSKKPILQPSKRLQNYQLQGKIGSGNFSEVWLAIELSTKTEFAIKVLDNNQIKVQPKVLELLSSEIKILETLNHQNVVRLHEAFYEQNHYYLVLEYCNGGDLQKFLKKEKKVSEKVAIGYLKQLLNGFQALHSISAMHRDFKPGNVLIHDGILKIADLGFAKQASIAKTSLGTPFYMAPEVMDNLKYDNKIDIWSLGICFYEMLFGVPPFMGKDEDELKQKMKGNIIDFNFHGVKISDQSKQLIQSMLKPNPKERVEWADLYNNEILNTNDKKNTFEDVIKPINKQDLINKEQDDLFKQGKEFYNTKQNLNIDKETIEKKLEEEKEKFDFDFVEKNVEEKKGIPAQC